MTNFKRNARIASQQDFAKYRSNPAAAKAKGIHLVREQGNWLVVNMNSHLTDAFWKAWRERKDELKEAGYHVARIMGHWICY